MNIKIGLFDINEKIYINFTENDRNLYNVLQRFFSIILYTEFVAERYQGAFLIILCVYKLLKINYIEHYLSFN